MSPERRNENLALAFQELLTLGERLRSNRQVVTNAQAFRAQIWEAVKAADRDARSYGYPAEDIELAVFAVIAFLDESILNLRQPVFSDWPRQPLQEERYGHHIAGEIFFQNLQKLLGRTDSMALADLLEVYTLCLLLGFAGRYSLGNRGELRAVVQQTTEKLHRIRKPSAILSPDGALPPGNVAIATGDPWVQRLMIGAISSAALTAILFFIFRMFLSSGARGLSDFASQG
jgi:type VI secretion system protein ImpK